MSNLLINESPLQVLPTLAKFIGLNEAVVLQQMHYWLSNKKMGKTDDNGVKWIRNTITEWQEDNFIFWSEPTIKRVLNNLTSDKLVLWTDKLNRRKDDRTRWYTIDYKMLGKIETPIARIAKINASRKKSSHIARAIDQLDTLGGNRSSRSPARYQVDLLQEINLIPTLPETTSETTSKNQKSPNGGKDDFSDILGETDSEPTQQPQSPNGKPDLQSLTEADKAHLQTFGFLPGKKPLTYDIRQELIQAKWNITITNVEKVIALYILLVRVYRPKFAIPNDISVRKDWHKAIQGHLQDYALDDLPDLYKKALARLDNGKMTYTRPGSLTKILADVASEEPKGVNFDKVAKSGIVAAY